MILTKIYAHASSLLRVAESILSYVLFNRRRCVCRRKGRSPFGWFFLSCLLSSIITIILIAIMPRVPKSPQGLEARLNEVQRLLDKGVITNDEYQSKRKAIFENN